VARVSLRLRDRAGGRLRLEIGRREGSYQIPPRPLRIVAHGCPTPNAVHLDGGRLADGTATPGYGVANGRVQVRLVDQGEAHVLEIEPAP
jgi:hypothetical protein